MSALMEADPLVVVLRQTELIPSEALERFLRGLTSPLSGPALLEALAAAQLLTQHQVRFIQTGNIRELELGPYRIVDKLGSGTTGSVFLCEHKKTNQRFAIKVLDPEWSNRDPGVLARFRREARACSLLTHPNIVRAIDLEEADGKTFLVMEYIAGMSLADLVDKTGEMHIAEAVEIIGQAALGLQHIHECGLVHRDIKPGNLLLGRDGQLKILDLGLARFTNSQDDLTVRQGYGVVGTLDYMAPEQTTASSVVDIRADIYALGATLYFLLTGEPPIPCSGSLSTKVMALQFRSPRALSYYRPEVDQDLQEIVDRMLAKARENRYATPVECAWALSNWLEKHAGQVMPGKPSASGGKNGPPSVRTPKTSIPARASAPKTQYQRMPSPYRWLARAAILAIVCLGIALICGW